MNGSGHDRKQSSVLQKDELVAFVDIWPENGGSRLRRSLLEAATNLAANV